MGFFSKIFKSVAKVAKIAIPTAIAYYTGGPVAAASTAFQSVSSATAGKKTQSSPITGAVSTISQAQAAANTSSSEAKQAAQEQARLVALNAQGASGNATTPLGVTTGAKVTKRKLLGGS